MGHSIVAGRDFTDADGTPQPAAPAAPQGAPPPPRLPNSVILSYEFWHRRFGGDASVLNRPLPGLNPQNVLIPVGVAAPHFQLLFPADADVETSPDYAICGRIPYDAANRNNVQWRVVQVSSRLMELRQVESSAFERAIAERASYVQFSVVDREQRLFAIQERWDSLRQAKVALANDDFVAAIRTGVVCRRVRWVGGKDGREVVEYEINTALIESLNSVEKRAAVETGQESENVNLTGQPESGISLFL